MTPSAIRADLTFPHIWQARILPSRPLILPARHFIYPREAEEVERGAMEVMVRPEATAPEFLATCALGFQDPIVPSGLWFCPNPNELCALSGGYAYLIDTREPERFTICLLYTSFVKGHAQIFVRVHRHVVYANFIVEVGPGGAAGLPNIADHLPARNVLTLNHRDS